MLFERIRVGLFEVNVHTSSLLRQDRCLRLREQPLQLLIARLNTTGAVVTGEELR